MLKPFYSVETKSNFKLKSLKILELNFISCFLLLEEAECFKFTVNHSFSWQNEGGKPILVLAKLHRQQNDGKIKTTCWTSTHLQPFKVNKLAENSIFQVHKGCFPSSAYLDKYAETFHFEHL